MLSDKVDGWMDGWVVGYVERNKEKLYRNKRRKEHVDPF
jgi:beta-lactamase class D